MVEINPNLNVQNIKQIFFRGNDNGQGTHYLSGPAQPDTFESSQKPQTSEVSVSKPFIYKMSDFIQNSLNPAKNVNHAGDKYFDYHTDFDPISIPKSLEDIPMRNACCRDARFHDISGLNLSEDELLNLCIDKTTVMSPEQKAIVDKYKELAKNPGLGIRNLHKKGITGKGVKIAIIDQPLGKHKEYNDNLIYHKDVNVKEISNDIPGWSLASLHGAAVASIAVGKSVGVAPDADLVYYSAVNRSTDPKEVEEYIKNLDSEIEKNKDNPNMVEFLNRQKNELKTVWGVPSNKPCADAINEILDKNKELPDNEKIPVISISWGFDELAPGYNEVRQAIERAKKEGVFVISTALEYTHGFDTCGANRNPKGDLDSCETYEAGAFWKENSENIDKSKCDNSLLVPMDHRTVADCTDDNSYRYEGNDGGMSWSTPWLAGMYVLAKQVKPDITPEEFWQKALETSNECRNNDSNAYVGRIVNPEKLIESLS